MPGRKLTYDEAEEIRREYAESDRTQKELAAEHDTSKTAVWRIVNNQSYEEPLDMKRPEPDLSGWTPCQQCEILCPDDLCGACKRELARGITYSDTPEYLEERYGH